jgi:hypothetical protein
VIVEGAEGYQRTFEADELAVLMREAVARRRAQAPAAEGRGARGQGRFDSRARRPV